MSNKFKKILISIILIVLGITVGYIISNKFVVSKSISSNENILSSKEIGDKSIKYLNEKLLKNVGLTASLVTEPQINNELGMYEFKVKIQNEEATLYVTKNGKFLFSQPLDLTKEPPTAQGTSTGEQEGKPTLGGFSETENQICKENDKPIVYFFGSESCSHCKWESPIIEKVASEFKNYISLHSNIDKNADEEIFSKYSTGGIPTIVLGCKYYRVGSGESIGEEEEEKVLKELICNLTDKKPKEICEKI